MLKAGRPRVDTCRMSRIRRLSVVAVFAVITGLIGAVIAASDGGTPAPIVWHDHVLDPTTTSTR
jgi:hypothetical protein